MDLSFLQTYCIPVIVGICLCVGYVIKNSLTLVQNKY
ncbi:holin, partial [Turicibacter sanguinis]|nr:holin [Turicibacter sanguinis]